MKKGKRELMGLYLVGQGCMNCAGYLPSWYVLVKIAQTTWNSLGKRPKGPIITSPNMIGHIGTGMSGMTGMTGEVICLVLLDQLVEQLQ